MANPKHSTVIQNGNGTGGMKEREYLGGSNDFVSAVSWSEILTVIKKYFLLLILIIVLCSGGYAAVRSFIHPAQYSSTATIFLTPRFDKEGDVDQNSVNTNRTLLNNVIALMTRENVLTAASQEVGNMSPDQIRDTLSVNNISGTELISITSTTTDPQLSKSIVEATVNSFITTMQGNLNLDNITIVDQPKLNFNSVSTPIYIYALQGAGIGLLIDIAFVIVKTLMNTRLRSKEDAERYLGVPVLVVLPDLEK